MWLTLRTNNVSCSLSASLKHIVLFGRISTFINFDLLDLNIESVMINVQVMVIFV